MQKMFWMLGLVLSSSVVVTMAEGPATRPEPPASAPATATAPATAPALSLAGKKFISAQKQEVGRGVNGPAQGNWRLTFSDKRVSWRYSDVGESLSYTIDAEGNIKAESGMRGKGVTGKYNAATKELEWAGVMYKEE